MRHNRSSVLTMRAHGRKMGPMLTTTRASDQRRSRPRPSGPDDETLALGTSVGKALALLDALGAGSPSLGVSELARRVDLPKSTAFRLLACLEKAGYVGRLGTEYHLGQRLFELGNQIAPCRPKGLRDIALPFMSDLVERSQQTVHLAVLDGVDVLYLEKLFGHRATRAPSRVGGRVPAACCGLGKAMLAHSSPALVNEVLSTGLERRTPYTISMRRLFVEELAEIRRVGLAFDREEAVLGLTCVAAPILKDGAAVAALSVTGPTVSFDPTDLASRLRLTATAIAAELS